MSLVESIVLLAPPLIVAVVIHEVAHGWVAEKLGDPTARALGRITLNPIKHIDPVLTLLLPGLLILSGSPVVFGGAKPVPVDPRHFKNPRRGMAIVALAGPVVNFILAAACCLALKFSIPYLQSGALQPPSAVSLVAFGWLFHGLLVNLVLGTFNLIPIPPLDGGRILVGFLPLPWARRVAKLERWGLPLVFLLLYLGAVRQVLDPIVSTVLKFLVSEAGL